jgi:hypothetical protein
MAGKKKTREVASFGPVLGGIQSDTERRTRLSSSVDGNDDGAQRRTGMKSNPFILLLHENLLALEWQKATMYRPTLMS